MKRKHINLKTKLAAALLALDHIPYEDSKLMTAQQIISLFEFDHGVLHAHGGVDEPWNLTPKLIKPHRRKSKLDRSIIAKSKRIDKKWNEFTSTVLAKPVRLAKYKWPKRKFRT